MVLQQLLSNILFLLAVVLGGFLAGNMLLLVGWPSTPLVQTFIGTPEFLIWLYLVSLLFAILPLCAIYGTIIVIQLYSKGQRLSWRSLLALLILLVLFFLPFMTLAHFPKVLPPVDLPSFEARVETVTLFCGVCATPAAIGVLLMPGAIQQLNSDSSSFSKRYFQAKAQLNGLLGAIGLIIGLGTLTTGALQRALSVFYQASQLADDNAFPPILAIVYGAYFSVILILLYWPLEQGLHRRAKQFLDTHIPLPVPTSEDWEKVYAKRQIAINWLDCNNAKLTVRSGLAIFAPLLSGLISYLLSS